MKAIIDKTDGYRTQLIDLLKAFNEALGKHLPSNYSSGAIALDYAKYLMSLGSPVVFAEDDVANDAKNLLKMENIMKVYCVPYDVSKHNFAYVNYDATAMKQNNGGKDVYTYTESKDPQAGEYIFNARKMTPAQIVLALALGGKVTDQMRKLYGKEGKKPTNKRFIRALAEDASPQMIAKMVFACRMNIWFAKRIGENGIFKEAQDKDSTDKRTFWYTPKRTQEQKDKKERAKAVKLNIVDKRTIAIFDVINSYSKTEFKEKSGYNSNFFCKGEYAILFNYVLKGTQQGEAGKEYIKVPIAHVKDVKSNFGKFLDKNGDPEAGVTLNEITE
jgi:hypothetical protein